MSGDFFYTDVFGNILKDNFNHLVFSDSNNGLSATIDKSATYQTNGNNFATLDIYVVYFINAYCNNKYFILMEDQLRRFQQLKLPYVKFYVEACCDTEEITNLGKRVLSIIPDAIITTHSENNHEYYGIKRVSDVSKLYPTGITLYFHSKGISRLEDENLININTEEKKIFQIVVTNYKHVCNIFNRFQSINKVGCGSGGNGWIWYNFWWARNEYLKYCEEPVLTDRRHYYEDWLGRYIGPDRKLKEWQNAENVLSPYQTLKDDCFNLITYEEKYNIGSLHDPNRINHYINQIN